MLAGQQIGIDYPFLNATISTLLRVELLSGDRYAHMLVPGEGRPGEPAPLPVVVKPDIAAEPQMRESL